MNRLQEAGKLIICAGRNGLALIEAGCRLLGRHSGSVLSTLHLPALEVFSQQVSDQR